MTWVTRKKNEKEKKMLKKLEMIMSLILLTVALSACGKEEVSSNMNVTLSEEVAESTVFSSEMTTETELEEMESEEGDTDQLEISFGADSKIFTVVLADNLTAAELVKNLDEGGMNLPIYHFDDFENYEVMQYYDIPNRFEIPSESETVTSEKAGDLYYMAPNRIVLFYQDAEITGEYTKVGSMEDVEGLKAAVEDNTVVPGWGNKIITVNRASGN